MGVVLAKFRKEKTTAVVLENLEERIQQIEKYSFNTQEQKKRFVGNFLAISIGVYVVAFLVFYFVYFPPTWKERIIYSVPLFLFPFVIIFLRRAFTWYFQRKINNNSTKLSALRDEKKKILEQVMDKETYKVAVNLLARFGEKTNANKSYAPRLSMGTPARPNQSMRALTTTSSNQLNSTARALNTSIVSSPRQAPSTPGAGGFNNNNNTSMSRQLVTTPQSRAGQELRRRTPFPIVNQQDKGVFERIVDVLIGDGPQDRFAMICKECFAHNGMALKEEFDFATFRCAFCNALNPSRKARPVAPSLPMQLPGTPSRIAVRDSSDSSSSSSEDEEFEKENENLAVRASDNEIVEASSAGASEATTAVEELDDTPEGNDVHAEQKKSEISKQQDELKKEM